MSKKIFQRIFSDEVSLQDRIFYVTVISAFIACFLSAIATFTMDLPVICDVLSVVATSLVFFFGIYSFCTKKTKFVSIFLNIILGWIVLPFMFITEGGSQGGCSFYLLTIALTGSFTLKKRMKVFFMIFCIVEYAGLFIFEYYHPEFIIPLPEDSVLGDKISGIILTFILLILYVNVFIRQYEKYHKRLTKMTDMYSHQANTDELTELFNRRYFKEAFTRNLYDDDSEIPDDRDIFIAMFDIDDFKKINDTYGHLFGDKVLKQFAEILFEESTNGSVSCRYGGEEFMIMIKEKQFKYAYAKVELILNKTKNRIHCGSEKKSVTVSAGLVLCKKDKDYSAILKEVDEKLYEAKKNGKNRVVC